MYKIEKADLNKNDIEQLCRLSEIWASEDISWGIVANTIDDIKQPVFVARDENKIVGYCFGSFYTMERKLSGIEKKSKCFSVDELYVLPQYRNKGIGKKLLDSLIEEIKQRADYITLTTSTKDYTVIKIRWIFMMPFYLKKLRNKKLRCFVEVFVCLF